MDYDRYDATLHYIFKQTQGDAWFRPHEDSVPPGVCLRTHDGQFRVFPYETAALAPFEAAVAALNPLVAVKVRSAAVHAALAEQAIDDCIYVDSNTRIQVLESMYLLPQAEKDQNAAFIRDERVLVVWSDSLDTIIPIARDFEDRLIRLLWRTRPPLPSTHEPSIYSEKPADPRLTPSSTVNSDSQRRTWFGRVVPSQQDPEKTEQKQPTRPIMLYAPLYNGLCAALAFSKSQYPFCFLSLTFSSFHRQRRSHSSYRISPRRQLHSFCSWRPSATSLLCILGNYSFYTIYLRLLFPVLHSSNIPNTHICNRSHRSLPPKQSLLLGSPSTAKPCHRQCTPSHHNTDARLQRKPCYSPVSLFFVG